MMRFASVYEVREILATLVPILAWSHFLQLIALEDADVPRFSRLRLGTGSVSVRGPVQPSPHAHHTPCIEKRYHTR